MFLRHIFLSGKWYGLDVPCVSERVRHDVEHLPNIMFASDHFILGMETTMLVLSRKQNQTVVFPNLGITVEILRTAGKTVQVGVEAPRDVQILRGELTANSGASLDSSTAQSKSHSKAQHEMRNRLNKANLAIKLLQKQIAAGRIEDAETSLAVALEAFGEMEQMVTTPAPFKSSPGLATSSTSPGPKRKRALLVEDDPNERVLLAAYLRSSGFEVDTAEDGQEALDYLAHQKPDAVVMDMEMPRLHGAECVKEIRSDHHFDDMKLFVVSGMEQRASNVLSGDRGVQRWFQKPLSPEDLVHALESSLN